LRKTRQKRESGYESDAAHSILGAAVKIDNFARSDLRVVRHMIQIESEFRIVTNRDLNDSRTESHSATAVSVRGHNGADSLGQPIKRMIWFGSRVRNDYWIEENCDRRVGGCAFDDSGNLRVLEATKHFQDLV